MPCLISAFLLSVVNSFGEEKIVPLLFSNAEISKLNAFPVIEFKIVNPNEPPPVTPLLQTLSNNVTFLLSVDR